MFGTLAMSRSGEKVARTMPELTLAQALAWSARQAEVLAGFAARFDALRSTGGQSTSSAASISEDISGHGHAEDEQGSEDTAAGALLLARGEYPHGIAGATSNRPLMLSGASDGADTLFGEHALRVGHGVVHVLGPSNEPSEEAAGVSLARAGAREARIKACLGCARCAAQSSYCTPKAKRGEITGRRVSRDM